ncbi:hypothetical protein BDP67DRAFT_158125 [Colletotrichum lupini]|nr:hypothetical protein BDP67DRAFT_158125 [Colletotrichum lupini]
MLWTSLLLLLGAQLSLTSQLHHRSSNNGSYALYPINLLYSSTPQISTYHVANPNTRHTRQIHSPRPGKHSHIPPHPRRKSLHDHGKLLRGQLHRRHRAHPPRRLQGDLHARRPQRRQPRRPRQRFPFGDHCGRNVGP